MSSIGLIVNPSAGRDIRRITGAASVVDNLSKKNVAKCVLEGLNAVGVSDVFVMPDASGIGSTTVTNAPDAINVQIVDIPTRDNRQDTLRTVSHLTNQVDVFIILGGDGTTCDAALEAGDTPILGISTGTNNVVPEAVDGTIAGIAAGLLATRSVSLKDATYRHTMIKAEISGQSDPLFGLASIEVVNQTFVGSRAVLSPDHLLGGMVSRANPGEIGLPGVAGGVTGLRPEEGDGIGLRLAHGEDADRLVTAVISPGIVGDIGVESSYRVTSNESMSFEVTDGVLGADGERTREIQDATVELMPVDDGPYLVSCQQVFDSVVRAKSDIEKQIPDSGRK